MSVPTLRVELIARNTSRFFNYIIWGDSVWGGTDVWAASDESPIDVTQYVRSVSINRGRSRDIDEFRAGMCSIEFNNVGRIFDPTNTDSVLYGNVEPMRGIVVTAVLNGTDYPLFYGFAQQWTVDYTQPTLPLAGVTAADSLAILANQEIDAIAASYSGDLSGARVTRVLDRPEVMFPTDLRAIDAGESTFGATTFGENAARYLQLAAQSEGGTLYVASDGTLTFEERNTPPGAAVCTFSDDGDANNIRYQRIDQDMSVDLLYNRVITSGTTGNEQTVEDTVSEGVYQIRTLQRTGQLTLSDVEMAAQAQVLLTRFSTPEMRLRQVEVNLGAISAARQAEILSLELTDRVAVEVHPTGGSPAEINQAALVNGLDWQVSNGGQVFVATVTLEAGSRAIPFIWGDDALGVWGANYWSY